MFEGNNGDDCGRPVWAEVDLAAIRHNVRALRGLLSSGTKLCAVVKADGYGHGACRVASEAVRAGADCLAVGILDEALELRGAGFAQPILVLGFTPPEQALLVADAGIAQTIFNREQAEALSAAGMARGRKIPVHVKIDTGMGRLGVPPDAAAGFAARVAALPGIVMEGVFTHFACADSGDKTHVRGQFAAFSRALDAIASRGLAVPVRHCSNSAAILDHPEMHLDMVRAGIALYGLWPSEEVARPVDLRPAMRLKARVAMVKDVPAGTGLGYGCAYTTPAPATIATMPLGYADGWPRALGNRGRIVFRGGRAPLVGRVCMDQFLADVTGLGVREGDIALLFGDPDLPAEELASLLGTINYEIVCMLGKRVPRIYTNPE